MVVVQDQVPTVVLPPELSDVDVICYSFHLIGGHRSLFRSVQCGRGVLAAAKEKEGWWRCQQGKTTGLVRFRCLSPAKLYNTVRSMNQL